MLESSLKIGSVAGIRIGVHYTWLIIFLLLSYTLYPAFAHVNPEWSATTDWMGAIVTSLLFFGSIILHELGHSIVAIRRGIAVRSITLFVFGGVAQTERDANNAPTEFFIAIAGPLVSLVLAAIFWILVGALSSISLLAAAGCSILAYFNLLVAGFNMIPGFPLDGGRVFRALVWGATGDPVKGMRWAVTAGTIVAYGLMGWGIYAIATGASVGGVWRVAIGWFLLMAARASGRAFTSNRATQGLTIGELMSRDIPTVPASMTIDDWVHHHVLLEGARAALVAENGSMVGLVTLSDSHKVEKDRWSTTVLRDVMTPMERLKAVSTDTPVSTVLEFMQQNSLNQIPVVDDGHVVGWIDRERLMSILRLRVEAGS